MTYTILIPVYNEQEALPRLLSEIKKLDDKIEIIFIDDGSDDNTSSLLANDKRIKSVKNKSNLGKGASIRKGINIASNQNVILMDGDLEIDINSIVKLIDEYEKNNYSVIVGVRWQKHGKALFQINRLGNFFINCLFNFLYLKNFNDVLCCVRILDINLLKSLKLQSEGFSIEIETIAKLVLKGEPIAEYNVQYKRRTQKEGKKLRLTDSWDIILTMIKIRLT